MKTRTCKSICGNFVAMFTVVASTILPTWADVNMETLLNESAMWLDASSSSRFEIDQDGNVTEWKNRSSSGSPVYGNAKAYKVGSTQKYGKYQIVHGVPAYDMGAIASYIDLNYTEISGIRTVFIVGSFVACPSNVDYHVPLLGHSSRYDFHRGDRDGLWSTQWAPLSLGGTATSMTFYLNSDTKTVADTDTTTPVFNAMNIITIEVDGAVDARSNQLSLDRNQRSGMASGGRALSEVLIFTRALSAEERMAVYGYLYEKWRKGGHLSALLNESAMWLDASDPSRFEFDQDGNVTEWKNRSSSGSLVYGNAHAYKAGSSAQKYGKYHEVCGVPAYDMGAIASCIDLNYTEISGIRTVFIAGSFVATPSGKEYHVPLLGHSTRWDFHRGDNDALWSTRWAPQSFGGTATSMTFYLNSDTTTVANTDTTKPVFNAMNIITIEVDGAVDARSNQLSLDRDKVSGAGTASGGRALSEVLIFTRALTADERKAVYGYLEDKWNNGGWMSYLVTSTWNTGDGAWTDTAWNNDANGWNIGEYRHLVFAANASGLGETAAIQTSGATKNVGNVLIAEDAPRYVITGETLVEALTFTSEATAGIAWSTPLKVYGDMTLASTTAAQSFSNLQGVGGSVTVPAASGGEVALGFTGPSASTLNTLTIGAGKAVELDNRQSGYLTVNKTIGDATTKLRLTGGGQTQNTIYLEGNDNNFRGRVEIDGTRVIANKNSMRNITATEESPLVIRGEGAWAQFGKQPGTALLLLPDNASVSVEDGGKLVLWGANPVGQETSPTVTLTNGSVLAYNDAGSSNYHMHLKRIHMKGASEVHMVGIVSGWNAQGLIFWDKVTVSAGSSRIWRDSGNPNTLEFATKPNGTYTTVSGTFEVLEDATLTLAVKTGHPPHKTGTGLLVLDEGCELANGTLYLDEGLLKANSFAAALERIEVQDGVGFDLTAEGSEFGSSTTVIAAASGTTIRLKTGSRKLRSGMRLGTWATGTAPSCPFELEIDENVAKNYYAVARSDGVYVISSGLMILVR